eukprot:CAMPEP_0176097734 /NCGR_PEP_ID=MMETSP0120_2-20121206/49002_1 /TAXON_ID=160619 /ORGANISM="Kryptoperidinium foliaceum, Strain CCMP 1326" /LENGTH=128 /DNA_ID=CAMNT_0017431737 /DNA_START=161 /DNA_END=547 /DNA_ORIENTATION=-
MATAAAAFAPSMGNGRTTTHLCDGNGTGGWGIGGSREMVPEEFARGDRRYFDGYKMRDQGDFRQQIKEDQDALKKSELDELLGVAQIAGIKVKDPKERLNKFDQGMLDDEDDLDLSVAIAAGGVFLPH